MSDGSWETQRDKRERSALQREQREQEREQIRLEKRMLRDLRWAVERSTIEATDWADLLTLQQAHGKEGPLQLWRELVPFWCASQKINGGAQCPKELFPAGESGILDNYSQKIARTKPKSRKAPGAPRKQRTDAGKPRGPYKPRQPA